MQRVAIPSLLSVTGFCFLFFSSVLLAQEEGEKSWQKNNFSLRPKAGGLFLFDGRLKRHGFDTLTQVEVGVKGTFSHLGFEVSLAGDWDEITQDFGPDEKERKLRIGGLKLTATYETNPRAGLRGWGMQGNVYFGGGLGFYPYTEKIYINYSDPSKGRQHLEDQDGFGWGLHLVLGAEYFFIEHLSLFGEVQYSYIDFSRKARSHVNLHGISLLGGIAVKF